MDSNLLEDMKKDEALIKEALEKYDSYAEMSKWISKIWKKKYFPEFRGTIELSYDLVENKFILKCGDNTKTYEEHELNMIPEDLMFFRKASKIK